MEGNEEYIRSKGHSKTIIHIDIDCFYVQVELLKQPQLNNEPVGVKQKNIVVTCNYAARKYGVQKCMLISEALRICPHLILFNGEDLYKYRHASHQIHTFLLSFTDRVEKGGFDENYLDVTKLVKEKELEQKFLKEITGHCIGQLQDSCACGCHQRLCIGSQIANEIREKLKNNLSFTSSCGVSYNKLLAKLSCSAHKPNDQTTLLPNGSIEFLQNLGDVSEVPGVGAKCKQLLDSINVKTVKDLQRIDLRSLKKVFKSEASAISVKNLSLGICDSEIKPSGKQNSISVEDGFKNISVESEVKEKFKMLLRRLMILVEEDGRVPGTLKVTVRKCDISKKTSYRETKQSPVQTCLFGHPVGKLTEESTEKFLAIIMRLFYKMVNASKPFHVTLLGLAFSRFGEKVNAGSVAAFLLNKRDLSVHSLTSFTSDETSTDTENVTFPCVKPDSDSEAEPSPKKTKLDPNIWKGDLGEDVETSPSKLKVEDLNINEDLDSIVRYPNDVDPTVFRELPPDVQNDLLREWGTRRAKLETKCRTNQSLIHFFFLPKQNNFYK